LSRFVADFSDFDALARVLDRHYRHRSRPLRFFISEWGAPTDVLGYEFNFFVTREVQARWTRAAFRIAREWGRIYALGWVSLRDHPKTNSRFGPSQTGLIDLEGDKKPSYYVFKRGR
jgi:hypothetical protein